MSRWDAVYVLMLMLLFPLSITISNETVMLKFIVHSSFQHVFLHVEDQDIEQHFQI